MGKNKILVVEDEFEMRKMLALELEGAGYEVIEASDGEEGFRLAKEKSPDLIIADIMMPRLDGNQLMKKLRESDFGKDIPFMVLTARGRMRDYFEVMNVADFVTKPFDPADLLKRIKAVLDKRWTKKPSGGGHAHFGEHQSRAKILILDDDDSTAMTLKDALEVAGYTVMIDVNIARSLEDSILFHPDVIVMRFLLEGMNGDKLVQLMKGMPQVKDVPIVVYSNHALGWEREHVLKAGAAFFLEDIDPEKIIVAVREALKG